MEPRAGVTLRVTNGTCAPGPCASERVLLFPNNQPNTPGGLWSLDLGVMTASEMCFTIPESAKFLIIADNSPVSADTTTIRWTNAMPAKVGAVPLAGSGLTASPTSSEFVPAGSAGWRITLPGETQPVAETACTT
jgi:hypothetical protein